MNTFEKQLDCKSEYLYDLEEMSHIKFKLYSYSIYAEGYLRSMYKQELYFLSNLKCSDISNRSYHVSNLECHSV